MNYVLTNGDKNVLRQLRASISSLAIAAGDNTDLYTVVVAYDGDVHKARRFLSGLGVTVHVWPLGDVPQCKHLADSDSFYVKHPATLARLQPSKYLPVGVDIVLFADADTLFIADPLPLFLMPLGKWHVCAGVESASVNSCAGLLLYNLVAWRQNNVEETIAKRITCMIEPNDEKVLREILWGHTRFTPLLYNISNGKLSPFAVVVHFGMIKPWLCKLSAFAPAWFAFAYNLPRWICRLCVRLGRMVLLKG